MATARSRFPLTTGILQRRKLRYCSTNWDTSLGGFPRMTTPGTADLPETLPRYYGIARPRLARPHTTVREAASERRDPGVQPGDEPVKRTRNTGCITKRKLKGIAIAKE